MKVRARIVSVLLGFSLVFGSVNPIALASEQPVFEDVEVTSENAEETETVPETETAPETETDSDVALESEKASGQEENKVVSDQEAENESESDAEAEDKVPSSQEPEVDETADLSTASGEDTEADAKKDMEASSEPETDSDIGSYASSKVGGYYHETRNGVTRVMDAPEDVSGTADYNADVTGGAVQLPVPAGLYWDENFNMCFTGVEECHGHYGYQIYKDNVLYDSGTWSIGMDETDVSLTSSPDINDSGTYKFRVRSGNDYDPDNLITSEWSDFSEEKTYVRPDRVLDTTTAKWDKSNIGSFTYESVEGAGGYLVTRYIDRNDGNGIDELGSHWSVEKGKEDEGGQLRSDEIDITEEGIYYVTIRALSGDISAIANGEEGSMSEGLDTQNIASGVGDAIDSAIDGTSTADEAVDAISGSMNISEIQVAMQTDETVLSKIADLEKTYQEENGVSVGQNQVSEEASQYVNADDISMVGAAFNASGNASINLEVTVPETKIDVDTNRYADSVQLDLKLVSDSSEIHELRLPITITMPIPAGLDEVHLTILHYKNDGSTPETVEYRINSDKTITFTVTSFSDFVFAEEKDEDEHKIRIEKPQNGTVKCEVNGREAKIVKAGDTVKIATVPDSDFGVDTVSVTTDDDNGKTIETNRDAVNRNDFTFIMPDEDVLVKVTFKLLAVGSIHIKDNPAKTVYFVGDQFDPSGLSVEIVYDDNSAVPVLYTEENKTEFSFGVYADKALTEEDKEVEVTYKGKTAKIPITVYPAESRRMLKLTVNDIHITYGEAFALSYTAENAAGTAVTLESDKVTYKYFDAAGGEMAAAPVNAGEYTVQAVFGGNDTYDAAVSEKAKITIDKKNLTVSVKPSKETVEPDEEITYEIITEGFIGEDTFTKQPTVSIVEGSAEVEGTYKVQAGGGEAGDNYVINYVTATITVKDSEDAARPRITASGVSFPKNAASYSAVYTGDTICPVMTVTYSYTENGKPKKVTLKLNQDYIVTYANNVNAGTASVTVRGIGEYTGRVKKEFEIKQKSIAKVTISNVGDILYGQTPFITVMDGTHELTEGKDFTVAYTDGNENTDTVSTLTVNALPDGNYSGTANKKPKFTILAKNTTAESIAGASVAFKTAKTYTYSGKAVKPAVTVTLGGQKLASGNYKLVYSNNVNAGTASVYAVGITKKGKGCYGITKPLTFEIKPADFSKAAAKGSTVFPVNCNMKNIDITLKDGKNILTKGKDYTIDFSSVADADGKLKSNIAVGRKYEISVKANENGNFTGSSVKTVRISFSQLNLASKTANITAELHDVTDTRNFKIDVNYNGRKLVQGTDFTVNLKYNGSKDTYTATIKAVKNTMFKGSRTFKDMKVQKAE